MLELEWQSCI